MVKEVEMSKADSILARILGNDLLEDRREYDVSDLMKAYNISRSEAKILYRKIHKKTD